MSVEVVVGLQWGDEGKGKFVDIMSQKPAWIIRSQGGNNAGHTVIEGANEYKFHQVPSGILNPHSRCFIGAGTVISPADLLKEIEQLKKQGINFGNRLRISPFAHVIMPYHRDIDRKKEELRGSQSIGTTGRGIGPCYTDKATRIGVRMGDIIDESRLKDVLDIIMPMKNQELQNLYGLPTYSVESLINMFKEIGKELAPMVHAFELELIKAAENQHVILEGAQGSFLDLNFGTYPYVTSSNTLSASLCLGAGLPPTCVTSVTGVVKAYTTRVGSGPLPTEIPQHEIEHIFDHKSARETGTTTGRFRRIGWFDAVLVRTSAQMNGVNQLALTKIDILDSFDEILVCVGYKVGSTIFRELGYIPNWSSIEPVYEKIEGWKTSTFGITSFDKLPKLAKNYVQMIEKLINIPVKFISTGPKREDTILL